MRNEEPRAFCVLPAKPSHQVFPREEETESILQEMEKLKNAKPNEITVTYLSGNPGSGKSELARQIGDKVFDAVVPENEKEVKFVFTLNASSIDALVESYVEFAVSLNCDEESVTSIGQAKDSSQERKLMLLKNLVAPKLRKYSSWFLIVDNVTDLKSVFQHLPKAGEKTEFKGQILVTTQDSKSIAADDPHTYHLSLSHGMNPEEAMKTLAAISGIPADDTEFSSQVVQALDFQPLALACAAVYMKRVRKTKPTFSWEEYLQKLKQGKRSATEGEYKNTSIAYCKTMTVAVLLALEKEMSEDLVMKETFNFLSVMAPERIPLKYVVQYVTSRIPDEDEELVAANVVSSSLILSFEGQSQEIRVHQIVHGCLNTVLRPSNTDEFRFLLDTVKAFSTLLIPFDERNVSSIMATKSLVVHFVHISNKLSSCGEKQFGKDDDTLAAHLLSVGRICKVHGKNEQAHSFFAMCLKMKENIHGHNHPALVSTLNQLGGILGNLGKHEEASQYFERALAIQEQAEENPSKLASTLNNYGINLQDRGLYRDAKDRFKKALAIEMRVFGPNSTALATTLSNVGNCLDYLGQHKEAIDHFSMALDIEIRAFGLNHPHVASTLSNLGNSLVELEQHKEAEECFRRALAIEEMIFGPNHLTLATTLNNLGNYLGDLDKHEEAKDCFERALAIEEMTYDDPNHPELASTLSNLGNTLDDLEKNQEAEKCFRRALAIEEEALGPNHPDVATTLNNLGKCLGYQGKNRDARPLFVRALVIEEMAYDQNHPTLATTLNNLGKCHLDLCEKREAKHCFERALAIQQKALDPGHSDLASTMENLALVNTEGQNSC